MARSNPEIFVHQYYRELNRLDVELKEKNEDRNKFLRRREMAAHSSYNSDNFTKNVLEGEDNVKMALALASRRKEIFDNFSKEEWENNAIVLKKQDTDIISWCAEEFGYNPYTKNMGTKGTIYVFHNQEDAVATKLRWL